MESCHLAAARCVKLWSLNANLFFEEPHQLTKFPGPLKPYLAESISLQSSNYNILGLAALWPSSLTKPDLLRFRCSSGHVLSKTKSVTPNSFYISYITNSSSFNGKIFRKKSMLENFRANVLKVAYYSFSET